MIFAVHLFCYSALKERKGGKREGRCRPSQFRGLAGREKHGEKQTWNQKGKERKKKKQSEPPSLPPLFYCSTLFLVYPLSPHSFGESPGFELFFCCFFLSRFINEEKYNVDLLVILSIQQ